MNVPPALGQMLSSEGHKWRHVANIGMAKSQYAAILVEAQSRGECIITHDLDYGQLLAFSGDSTPSVLIFRLRRVDIPQLFERIHATWSEIEEPLASGAVVIIEEVAIRVRRLPVSKSN